MAVSVEKRLLTVEEYNEMGRVGILGPSDKVELIHGEIIKMSPTGSKHAATTDKLSDKLKSYIKENCIVRVQNPIRVDEYSEPVPDLTLVKFKSDFYRIEHPKSTDILLVIEVSDSSLLYDRKIKGGLYAKAKIPEYWIIDLENDRLEVYSNPKNGKYEDSGTLEKPNLVESYLINKEVRVGNLLI